MSGANYQHCQFKCLRQSTKVFYTGDADAPDDVYMFHKECFEANVAEALAGYIADHDSHTQSELANQPSTNNTPVADGVGGSESTNQSEHKEVK